MHDVNGNGQVARLRAATRAIALAGLLMVLLVTTSSAFLRVRAAGLGCSDWPACYGPQHTAIAEQQPGARLLHRISATLAGAAVVAIAVLALMRPRELRRELLLALLMLAVTAFLAALGRATPGARVPAVALGNVLGGMSMAALLAWVALGQRPRVAGAPIARAVAAITLVALFAQIGLGVLTSASWSGLACPALPSCTDGAGNFPADWSALNPWRLAAGSATVHMAHRAASLIVLLAVSVLAWVLGPGHPRLRLVLATLVLVQLALGAHLVLGALPLATAIAHNAIASFLLLAVVTAHHRLGRRP
jgi:cytochrome c oxidase assembly protein subunit 15